MRTVIASAPEMCENDHDSRQRRGEVDRTPPERRGQRPRVSRERVRRALFAWLVVPLLGIGALGHAHGCVRQDLTARLHNTPVGLNFALGLFLHTGSVGTDDPSRSRISRSGQWPHCCLRASLDVFGRSAKVDLIVPYVWLSAKEQWRTGSRTRGSDSPIPVSGFR